MRLAARLMAAVFTASLLLPALVAGSVLAAGPLDHIVIRPSTASTKAPGVDQTYTVEGFDSRRQRPRRCDR